MNDRNRNEKEEMEIDLLDLFSHLLRKWKTLLIGLVIGGILAGGFSLLKTPMYESTAMLFILSKTTSITSVADLQIGSELTADFTVIATSKPVIDSDIEKVEKESGVTLTREEIQDMLTVTNRTDTRILEITTTSDDPELACDVANAVTEATASQMASIMKSDPPTTVEKAEVADAPIDSGFMKNTAVGMLAGLIIVAVLWTIPYLKDDTIKTSEDVEKYLEMSVLASIPLDKELEHKNSKGKKGRVR